MTHSWLARRLGICLALALLALLVPTMAQAQANVFRFEFQEPLTGSTALPECLPPDLVGTQTGTETTVGQVTETGQTFQTISTTTIQEPRTIYSADGQPIGKVFLHALSHVTFRDANGNGVPDPGEITASVDRFFFTCH